MNILAIDTSNHVMGIAITKNSELVAEMMTNVKKDHSTRLMPAIVELMEKVDLRPKQLNKIVVAKGPGSYTGTRIGVTTAKTMAWSLQVSIYSVSSLRALAYNGMFFNGYICPFFDARRKMVFTSLYRFENGKLHEVFSECNMLMEEWLTKISRVNGNILFLSPHMSVYERMIKQTLGNQSIFPKESFHFPKPSNLIYISEEEKEESVHLVRPNYLRVTEAEANLLDKRQKDENKND